MYLETWHADIEEFLELKNNTGDEARRTHNLNLSNWIPDLFMKRVGNDQTWSLFDPKQVPELCDLYGKEFEKAYEEAEKNQLFIKQTSARTLYGKMMKTLAETGNGWMNFKDAANEKANQTLKKENVIHLSNLCTEILEVTSEKEIAVCNLGSVNLSEHVRKQKFQFDELQETVTTAVRYLDKVIDLNFYPVDISENSNSKWRPVGLGLMGLQDVFFKLDIPFDSEEAKHLSQKISEEIYYHAIKTSCELAKQHGPHPSFSDTRASQGLLQFDLWKDEKGNPITTNKDWSGLKEDVKKYGLRNSLLIAVAPTATIASIVGCTESSEPQISNLFKRETLSGEFIQINRYLVKKVKILGALDRADS